MLGRIVRESPVAPLVAFSAATNLGLAGRRVRVAPDVADPEPLRRLLRGFGAREEEPADVVFVADIDAAAADPGTGDLPVLVVGVGPQAPPPADAVLLRPGVEAASPVVSIVRAVTEPGGAAGRRIDWARSWMPVARAAAAELGELVRGTRIGLSLVLEPKTAVLALLLEEAGAEVTVFAFAAETDEAVAAVLRDRGIAVHASADATPDEERRYALALLDRRPRLLVDDGAHVIRLAHVERPEVLRGLIGATEETTSGVTPLRAMAADGALAVPVIAANDATSKSWFDNRHGTGETCVLAIVRALDRDLAGAAATVLGFGPVGEGVAQRLTALGAAVTVVERDPRRELAARFAGHATAASVAAADLIVSATGVPGTIGEPQLDGLSDAAVIAVAGGAPEEVRLPAGTVREPLARHLERLRLPNGGTVRLLAGGDGVNIVAGEGNPIDVMDLSFGVQLAAIRHLLEAPGGLRPGVHRLGDAADTHVAALALGSTDATSRVPAPSADWRRTRFDLGTSS